jgi:hypothetical protein
MHRSDFAVEEPHLPALRAAHGPFSGNRLPAAWVAADIVRIEDGKLAELGPASGRGDQGPIRQRAAEVRRPVPRLTLPHHVLGSWLFAAAMAQAQQLKHDAELIAASTLLHDIGLTAAFAGEVRFEITIGSGLQLDRSSVHFSSGLKSHLVEGLIDERQGTSF